MAALRRRVFTGRVAELRLLRELLLSDERGSFVVWLHGMGGLGKTALLHCCAASRTRWTRRA